MIVHHQGENSSSAWSVYQTVDRDTRSTRKLGSTFLSFFPSCLEPKNATCGRIVVMAS